MSNCINSIPRSSSHYLYLNITNVYLTKESHWTVVILESWILLRLPSQWTGTNLMSWLWMIVESYLHMAQDLSLY